MLKKIRKNLMEKHIYKMINIYPPYIGAGVKAKALDDKGEQVKVTMKLTTLNKNYVGTHFGGSLYSMCDPFYMLMLLQRIGKDHLVWDKKASIDFKRPGKGKVHAIFTLTDQRVQEIVDKVEKHGVYEPEFTIEVLDEDEKVVAIVHKTLWVKRK